MPSASLDRHIGARIRLRRLRLGLSQAVLAKTLGVDIRRLRAIEQGKLRAGPQRLATAAEFLAVPISYFFEDIERPATFTNFLP